MADKFNRPAFIQQVGRLTNDIVDLWLEEKDIAAAAKPGQFLSLYCRDGSRLLPRPISICETDTASGRIRLVFRIAGKGTEEFSGYQAGETIEVLGPLGNGFTLKKGSSVLMGGGIGIPPMLALCRALKEEYGEEALVTVILGYRDTVFLSGDFPENVKVYVATEDGSAGMKGNVIDVARACGLSGDRIYACGPTPMLRGVKSFAEELGVPAQISMEEKMACGIGACLACVCKSKELDEHSRVHNKRVCKEGPVFDTEEIEL